MIWGAVTGDGGVETQEERKDEREDREGRVELGDESRKKGGRGGMREEDVDEKVE